LIDNNTIKADKNIITYIGDGRYNVITIYCDDSFNANFLFMIVKNFKLLIDSLKIHNNYKIGGQGFTDAENEFNSLMEKRLESKIIKE
jgi:hypothetical protein